MQETGATVEATAVVARATDRRLRLSQELAY
jgi:hypothetical protein